MLWTGFYESNDPTNNVKAPKEDRVLRGGISLQSHHVLPIVLTITQQLMQYETKTHKIHTDKQI